MSRILMAIAITIPRLGWNMDEGVFVAWLKRDGDPVQPGDPLFSLEGEKATQDVESIDAGILRIPPTSPKPGATVPVGAVVGYLLQAGEDAPDLPADERMSVPASANGPGRARIEAETAAPPAPAATSARRIRISPLARRIARELGVDWSRLRGSGSSGRIRKADILAASTSMRAGTAPPRSVPMSPIRRTIAARMVESHLATAPVTLTTTIDAANLVNLRRQFRALDPDGRDVPSYTDFVVKLCALALKEHPALNSRWCEDHIQTLEDAHIGIAVDTDSGLLVPVIRDAAGLSLRQTAAVSRELVRKAREHALQPSEMRGGTFTVTNLGGFGVETFTPIINAPECAILGMGRIQRQPVMLGDRVVAGERMSLSLTFDHRLVDGAPAARFLQRVGRMIENPGPWFMP